MTTFFMSSTKKSNPVEQKPNSESDSKPIETQISESTQIVNDEQILAEESIISNDLSDIAESEENEHFFQAIATLYGKIEQDDQLGYAIKIGSNKYRLFIFPSKYRGWLKQIENHPDMPLYLRVYPKYQIIPRKPPEIYFQVVAWAEENQWSEPGIFIFKGIWQFVPQVRTPVISIYRNRGSRDHTEKFKASHLPVLMRRDDEASPFRFNPKIKKEDLPPRWFIQAKFKFIPSKDCWGWTEDLEPPTQEIPRYKRPIKSEASQQFTKSKDNFEAENDKLVQQKTPTKDTQTTAKTDMPKSKPKPKNLKNVSKDSKTQD